jgi:hypothetical protein
MACRVGITTPDVRKRYWQRRCKGFRNWKIVHRCHSKRDAQRLEEQLARQHGCKSWPGGAGPERGAWNVYHFEHGGCR